MLRLPGNSQGTLWMSEQRAAKSRWVWILPSIFGLATMLLWFWSVNQHRAQMRSVLWTDDTTIPLIVAGALNAPIATFAYPMHELFYPSTSNLKLLVLFLGVIALWSYVGWVWDRRRGCRSVGVKSRVVATLGILFGIFMVCVSIPMYHVGIIYKVVACLWAISICRHFSRYWRSTALGSG